MSTKSLPNKYVFLPVELATVEKIEEHRDSRIHTVKVKALKNEPRFNGNIEFFAEGDFSTFIGKNSSLSEANDKISMMKERGDVYSHEKMMISGYWINRNGGDVFVSNSHITLESYLNSIKKDKKDKRPNPDDNAMINGDYIYEFLTSPKLRTNGMFTFNNIAFNKFSDKEISSLFYACNDKNKSSVIFDIFENEDLYKNVNGITNVRIAYLKQLLSRNEFSSSLNAYMNMRMLGINEENSISLINKMGSKAIDKIKDDTFSISSLSFDEKAMVCKSFGAEVDSDIVNYSAIREAIRDMVSTGSTAFPVESSWRNDIKGFQYSILYKIIKRQNSKVPNIYTRKEDEILSINEMVKKALVSLGTTLEKHKNAFKKTSYAREKNGTKLIEIDSMSGLEQTHSYDSTYISNFENYKIEKNICENLKRLMENGYSPMPENTELVFDIDPYEAQKNAVRQSLDYKVSIITGGPGVGKTTVLNSVLKTLESTNKKNLVIKLVAPTGKAASRMSDATGREASTIHSLLKYSDMNGFQLNKDNQLDADIMVIDESSMVDAEVFNDLLSSLKSSTKLIIVGDKDQLPSVGAGAILQELISSKVIPFTILNEAKRQGADSGIVRYAYDIIKNKMPDLNQIRSNCNDLFFINANTDDDIMSHINRLVSRKLPSEGKRMEDIQLLAPRSDWDGEGITTRKLNNTLKNQMNRSRGPRLEQCKKFKYGDRIICNVNDSKYEISNGHQGVIVGVDNNNGMATVAFEHMDEGETVEFEQSYLRERGRFDLSYCMTIHKSQGSEYPIVIIPLSENRSDMFMLNAQLVYTAMTRGKKEVYFIGSEKALESAVNKTNEVARTSLLGKMLKSEFEQLPEHLVNSNVEIVLGPQNDNGTNQPTGNKDKNIKNIIAEPEYDAPYW